MGRQIQLKHLLVAEDYLLSKVDSESKNPAAKFCDGKQRLPPIGASDASCGVEALDEPFEGVLVRDCMMI